VKDPCIMRGPAVAYTGACAAANGIQRSFATLRMTAVERDDGGREG
jgi:hypothetical protein